MRWRAFAALLLIWPKAALAHGFGPDPTLQAALAEGVAVMLGWPAVAASLVAGGLLAGLARAHAPMLGPAVLVGQALGIALTVAPQPWQFFAPFAAGMLAAALALTGLYRHAGLALPGVAAVGMGAQLAALDGHRLGDLPVMIHLGYALVATILLAAVALPLAFGLRAGRAAPVVQVLGRVLASWCLASLVLMLAMVLRSA